MDHSTCLSLQVGLAQGRLPAAQARAVRAHLEGCEACQALLARWDPAWPVPDLAPGVLAALERPSWAWVPLSLAAALLLVTAFWVPERRWLAKDPGDAAWARGPESAKGGW